MSSEKRREFEELHGAFVIEDGLVRYHDGFIRENHPLGAISAPANPHERAQRILRYSEICLERKIEEFRDLHEELRVRSSTSNGFPPRAKLPRLKKLHAEVKALQTKVSSAEETVESTTPRSEIAHREAVDAVIEANAAFLTEIEQIEI